MDRHFTTVQLRNPLPAAQMQVADTLSRSQPTCKDFLSADKDDHHFPYVTEKTGHIVLPEGPQLHGMIASSSDDNSSFPPEVKNVQFVPVAFIPQPANVFAKQDLVPINQDEADTEDQDEVLFGPGRRNGYRLRLGTAELVSLPLTTDCPVESNIEVSRDIPPVSNEGTSSEAIGGPDISSNCAVVGSSSDSDTVASFYGDLFAGLF